MDKGHVKTDKELRKLERELKSMYKELSKELEKRLRAKYRQQKKLDTKEVRQEIKMLEDELKRLAIETEHANIRAKEMLQGQLERVVHINDQYAHDHIIEQMEKAGLNTSFNMLNSDVIKEIVRGDVFKELALDNFTDKNRIYKDLRRTMAQAIIQGESADQMARRIQKVMNNEYYEAIRIARTETTKAQNTARDASFKDAQALGIKMRKKWIAAGDKRVRPTHEALDGVEIPYDKTFDNGCEFPGVGGPASEVIMCRCTFVGIMEDYG